MILIQAYAHLLGIRFAIFFGSKTPNVNNMYNSIRFGSIQASLAVALILTALEVPEQTIVDDYLLSNRYLNIRTIASQGAELPLEFQDAITTMYLSDERYIRAAFHELNRRYGSVDQYLQRELGVDEAYKKRLQQLLLE